MSDDKEIVSSSFVPISKPKPVAAVEEGPKYPHIKVKLVGKDGNAFNLLGIVQREMKRNQCASEDISKFFEEATSGDYNHLLATIMKYVSVK